MLCDFSKLISYQKLDPKTKTNQTFLAPSHTSKTVYFLLFFFLFVKNMTLVFSTENLKIPFYTSLFHFTYPLLEFLNEMVYISRPYL